MADCAALEKKKLQPKHKQQHFSSPLRETHKNEPVNHQYAEQIFQIILFSKQTNIETQYPVHQKVSHTFCDPNICFIHCIPIWTLRFYATEENPAATGSFLPREEVTSRVIEVIKKHEKVQPDKVSERSHLEKDLGLDSLDAAEIVNEVEQEFSIEIPDEEAFKLTSVPDIVNYVASSPLAK
jgi:NADH dehydrogenase (ubiquinone) 1 alpha/beta subcomplex 1